MTKGNTLKTTIYLILCLLSFSCKNSSESVAVKELSDKEVLLNYLNCLKLNRIADAYLLLDDSC